MHDSDTKYLKDNLEGNLLKNITTPATKLVNPDSPVNFKVTDVGLVMGVQFDRVSTPGYGSLKSHIVYNGSLKF